jgi:ketosteroid isomerase-like protein
MSQEDVALARRGVDALNGGGLDAVIDLCDPEVEWIAIPGFLPDAEDFHGHAGVRAWFDKVGETLKEVHWEAQEIIDADERLFVVLKLRASGRASGVRGEVRIFQVWKIRDHRLIRLESYLSREEALEAAGLSE